MADNGSLIKASGSVRLGWVILEVLIALAIAVAIVWWTLPRKPREGSAKNDATDGKDDA